ncbi:MAG: hypothetical protein ACXU95_14510, partial [Isosphaeraceae bacterium]
MTKQWIAGRQTVADDVHTVVHGHRVLLPSEIPQSTSKDQRGGRTQDPDLFEIPYTTSVAAAAASVAVAQRPIGVQRPLPVSSSPARLA